MSDFTFDGFEPANTTPVPDVLFDELLSELNESELKVLLYIIRRTAGFKKQTDAISLTQFQKGIRKRATGEILDKGCGVKDRATIVKALASLEKKGCIQSDKGNDPQGDRATSTYRIRFRSGVVGKTNHPTDMGSRQNQPPWFAKPTTGSGQNQPGVVGDSNPQETVIQHNSLQETGKQGVRSATDPAPQPGADAPTHALYVYPHLPHVSVDDIAHPTRVVVELIPDDHPQWSEFDYKYRVRSAEEFAQDLRSSWGYDVTVEFVHRAPAKTVEAEPYRPDFNASQSRPASEDAAWQAYTEVAARTANVAQALASETPPAPQQSEQDSVAPAAELSTPVDKPDQESGQAAPAQTNLTGGARPASAYQPPRGSGKSKTTKGNTSNKVYFSVEGAAFRTWYEEIFEVQLDETAANARACNSLGIRTSVTYENVKLVKREIDLNKWAQTNNVAVTPQDLADDKSNIRWEKWLQSAQKRAKKAGNLSNPAPQDKGYTLAVNDPSYNIDDDFHNNAAAWALFDAPKGEVTHV